MSNINDLLYDKLGTLGFVGALPDRAYDHLGSLGYTGAMNDRLSLAGGLRTYVEDLLGAVSITKNFINLLGDPPQAYYELATPWVASGDFEIEVDFSTTSNLGMAFVGNSANTFDFFSLAGGTISGRINGTVISFATPDAKDGKLHKAILKIVGITPTVILDGVEYPESSLTTVSGTSNFNVIGQSSNSAFFKGIISNVKLTDLTTPANSLSFGLDNLTGDTEVNNGVTLNYRNIALDVRDTYTLVDGDWVGSEISQLIYSNLGTWIDSGNGSYISGGIESYSQMSGGYAAQGKYAVSAEVLTVPNEGIWAFGFRAPNNSVINYRQPAGFYEIEAYAEGGLMRITVEALTAGQTFSFKDLSVKRIIEVA